MVYHTIIRYVFEKRFGFPVYASILKKAHEPEADVFSFIHDTVVAIEVRMTQQTMFLKNTETFAESLARCGVKFHFAYPITPATDVMKRMAVILPQYGGKMLQMESELAVSSALAGAACTACCVRLPVPGPA